jgi:hypothetical protein
MRWSTQFQDVAHLRPSLCFQSLSAHSRHSRHAITISVSMSNAIFTQQSHNVASSGRACNLAMVGKGQVVCRAKPLSDWDSAGSLVTHNRRCLVHLNHGLAQRGALDHCSVDECSVSCISRLASGEAGHQHVTYIVVFRSFRSTSAPSTGPTTFEEIFEWAEVGCEMVSDFALARGRSVSVNIQKLSSYKLQVT